MRWVDRKLRLMCQTGIWGVIAVGMIVNAVLQLPILLLQWLAK